MSLADAAKIVKEVVKAVEKAELAIMEAAKAWRARSAKV